MATTLTDQYRNDVEPLLEQVLQTGDVEGAFADADFMDYKKLLVVVSKTFNLPVDTIAGLSRKREVMDARHAIAYYCVKELEWTSVKTGRMLNKDHSTILHSLTATRLLLDQVPSFRVRYELVKLRMQAELSNRALLMISASVSIERLQQQIAITAEHLNGAIEALTKLRDCFTTIEGMNHGEGRQDGEVNGNCDVSESHF